MRRALLLVALVAACRESREPKQKAAGSAGSGSAVAKDPWVTIDAGLDTPETRKKRAEAALGRVEAIQPKLAKLRGLPFDHPVPTAYQTTDDFRAYLHRELAKELPPEKSKKLSDAFLHIGLLAKPVDLAKSMEQTMVTQAAAYYDPAVKKFFVVMVPDSELMLDTMSAHELTHGLQDQRFDLKKFMQAEPALDDDQSYARQFIVEGDATFAMFLYAAASTVNSDEVNPALLKMLRAQIERFSQMDIAGYDKMMKDQAAAMPGMDADLKHSMDSVGELPPVVIGPLLAAYIKGAQAVSVAYDKGGWPAVDALYKEPPESSEQVLHPTTKLFPKKEHPKKVSLPKLEGEELTSNVMGELLWSVYFNLWVPDFAQRASEGWGGDRYTVVRKPDGKLLAYLATSWDTAEDAKQFEDAYRASVDKRFPAHDRKFLVKAAGSSVYILDGSDDAKLLDKLIKQTTIK